MFFRECSISFSKSASHLFRDIPYIIFILPTASFGPCSLVYDCREKPAQSGKSASMGAVLFTGTAVQISDGTGGDL